MCIFFAQEYDVYMGTLRQNLPQQTNKMFLLISVTLRYINFQNIRQIKVRQKYFGGNLFGENFQISADLFSAKTKLIKFYKIRFCRWKYKKRKKQRGDRE